MKYEMKQKQKRAKSENPTVKAPIGNLMGEKLKSKLNEVKFYEYLGFKNKSKEGLLF